VARVRTGNIKVRISRFKHLKKLLLAMLGGGKEKVLLLGKGETSDGREPRVPTVKKKEGRTSNKRNPLSLRDMFYVVSLTNVLKPCQNGYRLGANAEGDCEVGDKYKL